VELADPVAELVPQALEEADEVELAEEDVVPLLVDVAVERGLILAEADCEEVCVDDALLVAVADSAVPVDVGDTLAAGVTLFVAVAVLVCGLEGVAVAVLVEDSESLEAVAVPEGEGASEIVPRAEVETEGVLLVLGVPQFVTLLLAVLLALWEADFVALLLAVPDAVAEAEVEGADEEEMVGGGVRVGALEAVTVEVGEGDEEAETEGVAVAVLEPLEEVLAAALLVTEAVTEVEGQCEELGVVVPVVLLEPVGVREKLALEETLREAVTVEHALFEADTVLDVLCVTHEVAEGDKVAAGVDETEGEPLGVALTEALLVAEALSEREAVELAEVVSSIVEV
jgi:hypothetical protein